MLCLISSASFQEEISAHAVDVDDVSGDGTEAQDAEAAGHAGMRACFERDDLARIDVMDDGGLTVPRVREPSEMDCSGRGLQIVDDTAVRWGVGDNALGGRLVWAEVLTTDGAPVRAPDAPVYAAEV